MAMPTWQHPRLTPMSKVIVDFTSMTSVVVNLLVLGSVWPVMPFIVSLFFFCLVAVPLQSGFTISSFGVLK